MQPTSRETIQFRIPGDAKYVSLIRKGIQSIACNLGFPDDVVWDIEVCVTEAVANAVRHGSPGQLSNAIVVVCRFDDSKLTINVRDEGPGFTLASQCAGEEPFDESGRGLRMIFQLMDKVTVSHTQHGSRLRMVKDVRASSP